VHTNEHSDLDCYADASTNCHTDCLSHRDAYDYTDQHDDVDTDRNS